MGSEFRSVSGVIATVIGLTVVIYVGGIVFYSVYGTLDSTALSDVWLTYYTAIYDFFGIGLSTMLFIFILCIIAPILWIFLGNSDDGEDRI